MLTLAINGSESQARTLQGAMRKHGENVAIISNPGQKETFREVDAIHNVNGVRVIESRPYAVEPFP